MNIHGTGCGILDCIYADEDFSGPAYQRAMSRREGDGGLSPGRLVFSGALEGFMGKPYDTVLSELCGGRAPSASNLGGPSAVSLVHASQMLNRTSFKIRYYGVRGNDRVGDIFEEKIRSLPLEVKLSTKECPSSRVDAFSDPRWENGSGERSFVYRKGALDVFTSEDLEAGFFDAPILAFGGTALAPHIHDDLSALLRRAKKGGAVTEVNLVYDYRSELGSPGKKWKLGLDDDAYPHIDLLLADREEALRTSGKSGVKEAVSWFLAQGCGAVIVTGGRQPLIFAAGNAAPGSRGLFKAAGLQSLDVCETINRELAEHPERRGDTTGCGDNFTGQVIAGLGEEIAAGKRSGIDLREIIIPAIAAGGLACFFVGGTYYEKEEGEKRRMLQPYIESCRRQLGG
jgi:sugar/nucleoside kinase (ribokinase family)